MTSHSRCDLSVLGAAALLTGLVLAGCGSASDPAAVQVAVPAPAPPPPPPRPALTPVEQLMAEMGIDRRVRLPEEMAPPTDIERRAVLAFFDTFARGDSKSLGSMLGKLDRDELNELVASGDWAQTTRKITKIEVRTGKSPSEGSPCALAIFHVDGGDFQPQLWYYRADEQSAEFEAVATPPDVMDRLHGTDWITAWFALLEEDLALADEPDEEIIIPQRDVSDPNRPSAEPSAPGYSPSSPGDPSRPSSPGGPGGRRPHGPKRPAPGKGP